MIQYEFLNYSIPYDIIGVDLSRHNWPVQWTELLPLISFAIIRTGDGVTDNFLDERFPEAWRVLREARYPRGSYWFFRPEKNPIEQAKDMASRLAGDWGEMGYYLDMEMNETRMSKADFTNSMLKFIAEAEKVCPSTYNRLCGFYTTASFWNTNVDYTKIPRLADRPKWIAQWPYILPPNRPSASPSGWNRWDVWQWTAKGGDKYNGSGFGKKWGVYSWGLDVNVWRGSQSEFESYFHTKVVNHAPVYDQAKPPKAFKPSTSLAMRPRPDEYATTIMAATKLETLPVIAMDKDRMNRIWYKVAQNPDGKYQMWIPGWLGSPVDE